MSKDEVEKAVARKRDEWEAHKAAGREPREFEETFREDIPVGDNRVVRVERIRASDTGIEVVQVRHMFLRKNGKVVQKSRQGGVVLPSATTDDDAAAIVRALGKAFGLSVTVDLVF